MNVRVTLKQLDPSEALKTHCNSRSEKLSKFVGADTDFHWTLFVEHNDHVAELQVSGPHINLFAEATSDDMYSSVDSVTEKMHKQLQRNKEVLKDHLHRR